MLLQLKVVEVSDEEKVEGSGCDFYSKKALIELSYIV
jgi:hypothetical protein